MLLPDWRAAAENLSYDLNDGGVSNAIIETDAAGAVVQAGRRNV